MAGTSRACARPRGRRHAVCAALLLLAACGPAVESARYQPAPAAPRSDPAAIRIYENTVPLCDFTELGVVRVTPRHGWHSLESMVERLRARAAELGGDAVLGASIRDVITGGSVTDGVISTARERVVTGTVIRLADGCDPDAVRPRGGPGE
jgi:hypothetical protein